MSALDYPLGVILHKQKEWKTLSKSELYLLDLFDCQDTFDLQKKAVQAAIDMIEQELELIRSESESLKDDIFTNDSVKIETAIGWYNTFRNSGNDSRKEQQLLVSSKDLIECINRIIPRIKKCVDTTSKIDKKSNVEKMMSMFGHLSATTDANNVYARKYFSLFTTAVDYLYKIDNELNIEEDILKETKPKIKDFLNYITSDKVCELLKEYDPTETTYWLEVPKNSVRLLYADIKNDKKNDGKETKKMNLDDLKSVLENGGINFGA